MDRAHDSKPFILAFDHRGSFQDKVFGTVGRAATADRARVEHWVRTAAGAPGYAGFAFGRTIWWDAVAAWKDGALTRAQAAAAIGAAYRRFIDVYEGAEAEAPPGT